MKTLTVFTPTYNRKHTIWRTYESMLRQTSHDLEWMIIDDGSTDGTREWVESLGTKLPSTAKPVDWMGRVVEESKSLRVEKSKSSDTEEWEEALESKSLGVEKSKSSEAENSFCIEVPFADSVDILRITYIYKDNGGLYTGYNTAYANIMTELCVCIDSDDYMPDDAVEKILSLWKTAEPGKYCGITGLDYDVRSKEPIGGYFPDGISGMYFNELRLRKLHFGDTKQVMRMGLMKRAIPMIGFEGEKNFNPIYILLQVMDTYPMLYLNENLCWVEYQLDESSMSQSIFKQYVNSPRSFAKMRLQEMSLKHNTLKDRIRSTVHYVSSCIIAKDKYWLRNSPRKLMTLLCSPLGCMLSVYIKIKAKK